MNDIPASWGVGARETARRLGPNFDTFDIPGYTGRRYPEEIYSSGMTRNNWEVSPAFNHGFWWGDRDFITHMNHQTGLRDFRRAERAVPTNALGIRGVHDLGFQVPFPFNDNIHNVWSRGMFDKPPIRQSPVIQRFLNMFDGNLPRPWAAPRINRQMDEIRENQWGGRFDQPQPSRPPARFGGLQPLPFMQNPLDRLARGDFDRFG